MSEVFVSYKQSERERMRPIADGLRALGVDVWFDESLTPDCAFTEVIAGVIQECRAQIVCWSPDAVRSEWVRGEAEIGRQRGVLISVMIEPVHLPPPFNMHHTESLAGWFGDPKHSGWRKLADAVGRKIGRPGLGERAALEASSNPDDWARWAQRYPDDPLADQAWTRVEAMQVDAARALVHGARKAAEKQAASRGHTVASDPARQRSLASVPTSSGVRANWALIGGGGVGAVVLIWMGLLFLPRLSLQSSPEPVATTTSAGIVAGAPEPQASSALGADKTGDAKPTLSPPETEKPAPANPTAEAITALARFSARDWSLNPQAMLERAARAVPLSSLRLAASRGDVRALTVLGAANVSPPDAYAIAANLPEGVRLLRMAADRNFSPGQYYLASACWNNPVLNCRDDVVPNIRAAAAQGHIYSQFHLAHMLQRNDFGLPIDATEGARYMRTVADAGLAAAQFWTGDIYEKGIGVAADRVTAVRYYKLAARQKYDSAQSALRRLGESW